jgi:hypothetical protein
MIGETAKYLLIEGVASSIVIDNPHMNMIQQGKPVASNRYLAVGVSFLFATPPPGKKVALSGADLSAAHMRRHWVSKDCAKELVKQLLPQNLYGIALLDRQLTEDKEISDCCPL